MKLEIKRLMSLKLCFFAAIIILGVNSLVHAETTVDTQQLPPYMQPEQLALIVAINMDDAQKAVFKDALTNCVSGIPDAIRRTMRKGGADLPKKVRRAIDREFSKFDKAMLKTLRQDQTEAWGTYLTSFESVMKDELARRMGR
ncbi:MAG: hypothetical protein ACPHHQ_04315 [Pseudomonadales bacterium]